MDLRSAVAGELLYRATRLFAATMAVVPRGLEPLLEYKRQGRSIVFVGWHGHDMANLVSYGRGFGPDARGVIMVRSNADGRALEHFGRRMHLDIVSLGMDPTSAQWAKGVVTMVNRVKGGKDALLAVDGPDGPAYTVKPGAAFIAQRAGAVIVPSAVAASRAVCLRYRWDDHLIPLPGSRIVVDLGAPLDPQPPDAPPPSIEDLQEQIGAALRLGVARARAFCAGRAWDCG